MVYACICGLHINCGVEMLSTVAHVKFHMIVTILVCGLHTNCGVEMISTVAHVKFHMIVTILV